MYLEEVVDQVLHLQSNGVSLKRRYGLYLLATGRIAYCLTAMNYKQRLLIICHRWVSSMRKMPANDSNTMPVATVIDNGHPEVCVQPGPRRFKNGGLPGPCTGGGGESEVTSKVQGQEDSSW